MASRSQHEAYRCPICLYSFRVPVSIPCGHTYCKACIELFWDSADQSAGFSCPECRKTFWRKPELNKNVSISSVLDGTTRPGSPGDWERSSPAVATGDGPELTGTGRETSTTDEATESLARSKQLASIKQTLTQREEETAVLVSHLESTDPKLQAAAEETKSRLRRGCAELTLAIRGESESALRAVDAERDARLSELRQQLRERREALRGLREALGGIASLEALREPAEFLQSCNLHCDRRLFTDAEPGLVQPSPARVARRKDREPLPATAPRPRPRRGLPVVHAGPVPRGPLVRATLLGGVHGPGEVVPRGSRVRRDPALRRRELARGERGLLVLGGRREETRGHARRGEASRRDAEQLRAESRPLPGLGGGHPVVLPRRHREAVVLVQPQIHRASAACTWTIRWWTFGDYSLIIIVVIQETLHTERYYSGRSPRHDPALYAAHHGTYTVSLATFKKLLKSHLFTDSQQTD